MAKASSGSDDHAKVKVRVIEFELEGSNATVENSIRQLTAALTPRNTITKLPPTKTTKELAGETESEPVIDAELVDEDVPLQNGDAPQQKKTPRPKGKSKPPTYLHDLLTPEQITAFKEFARAKNPTSRAKQYLVATFWLKEHGNIPTVNADRIYTCFKTAQWTIGFNDWRATFDHLVHEELMRKTGVSEFAVNPTGEEAVNKGTEA